jgi:ribosome-binding factor A
MSQRTDRVDELLRQEIGQIVTREIADPRVGFATITDVETSPDLRYAKVWVSVIGQAPDRRATIAALEHAMPFIRRELGKRLRLRRIPEFSVKLDESIERGSRVMQIINELESGAQPDELPVGESLPTPVPRMPRLEDAAESEWAVSGDAPSGRKPPRKRPSANRGATTSRGPTTPRGGRGRRKPA